MLRSKYLKRFAEFFIIGLLFGIIEDLLAVRAVSEVMITPRVIGIIFLVALPFAVISELIVGARTSSGTTGRPEYFRPRSPIFPPPLIEKFRRPDGRRNSVVRSNGGVYIKERRQRDDVLLSFRYGGLLGLGELALDDRKRHREQGVPVGDRELLQGDPIVPQLDQSHTREFQELSGNRRGAGWLAV